MRPPETEPWFSDAPGGRGVTGARSSSPTDAADSFYADDGRGAALRETRFVPLRNEHGRAGSGRRGPRHRFRQRILRRSSGRDSQPAGSASRLALKNGRFVETWVPPVGGRIGISRPLRRASRAGRTHRSSAARASLHGAPCRIAATPALSSRLIMATLARSSLPAAIAEPSWPIVSTPPCPIPTRLRASRTSPRT